MIIFWKLRITQEIKKINGLVGGHLLVANVEPPGAQHGHV